MSPYENMKAIVSHRMDGTLSNFRTKTRLMLNDKEITGETQLETMNGMKGKIDDTVFLLYVNRVRERNLSIVPVCFILHDSSCFIVTP
jgi:hypothetical protein